MIFRHLFPIITLLIIFATPASAVHLRVKDFTYTHLGTLDGLSSQRVYSLYKSKDNAVWLATKQGVDRNNGAVVSTYPISTGRRYSSVAGRVLKFAHSIQPCDDMYVFDNAGRIFFFNKIQNRFDLVIDVADELKKHVVLKDVLIDKDFLWIAMKEGVYKFMLNNGNKLQPTGKTFGCRYILPYKGKLLFCGVDGLYNENGRKLSDDVVICGYYDVKQNNLWLGTFDQGVKVIKNVDKTEQVVNLNITANPIRAIVPYSDNRSILIGVDGVGVYQATRTANEAELLFSANDGTNGVLHGNGVYDIMVDAWSNIIVASYSGGVDIARPVGSTTAVLRHIKNNSQSIINDHVNCVANLGSSYLLMGTDDGVSLYDINTSQWSHCSRGLVVLDMCKKPDGNLLIATYGNGVWEIKPDGSQHKMYSKSDGTLLDDHVYRLCYDKAGNLWMGTLFGSLTVMTPKGNKYFNVDNILALTPLSDGRMAIGSAYGLYLVGLNDKEPKAVNYMPDGASDANRYVNDIFENDDHKLWIATDGGGVYIYDLKTGNVQHQLTSENGLPTNSVTSITKDETGRVWLGTEKGIVFVKPDHPKEIFNVSYCYGLNTEYVQHAVANLDNGDIIYGTVDGAIIINPKNITRLSYKAKINIKGVHIHGYEDDTITDGMDDFRQSIADDLKHGKINLSYDERNFDILFESINLRNQFDIAYQYRMEGMEWSNIITQQFISFENLEPGTHTMHIRCISKTSGIVLDTETVTIHIGQPWWNSWWMWCIYITLLMLFFQAAWKSYQLHNKYLRQMRERVNLPTDDNGSENEPVTNRIEAVRVEVATAEKDEAEDNADDATTDEGREFVSMATKHTLKNLKDTNFTIDHLCREMGMSRTLFYVKLKTYTGNSPQEFVRAIRLEKAASLLRKGRSVTEVSVLTGFDNPKYFSTVFKKYFGISPSKYE